MGLEQLSVSALGGLRFSCTDRLDSPTELYKDRLSNYIKDNIVDVQKSLDADITMSVCLFVRGFGKRLTRWDWTVGNCTSSACLRRWMR